MWYYHQSRACTLSLVFLILYRLSFSVSFPLSQCIWVCSRAGAPWTIRCFIIVRTTLLSLVSNSSSSIIKSCQLTRIPKLYSPACWPTVNYPFGRWIPRSFHFYLGHVLLDGHERVTRAHGAAFRIWARRQKYEPSMKNELPKRHEALSNKILSNK